MKEIMKYLISFEQAINKLSRGKLKLTLRIIDIDLHAQVRQTCNPQPQHINKASTNQQYEFHNSRRVIYFADKNAVWK